MLWGKCSDIAFPYLPREDDDKEDKEEDKEDKGEDEKSI